LLSGWWFRRLIAVFAHSTARREASILFLESRTLCSAPGVFLDITSMLQALFQNQSVRTGILRETLCLESDTRGPFGVCKHTYLACRQQVNMLSDMLAHVVSQTLIDSEGLRNPRIADCACKLRSRYIPTHISRTVLAHSECLHGRLQRG
jgi:hypothetical protein